MKKSGDMMPLEQLVGIVILFFFLMTGYSVSAHAYGALREPDEDQKALKSFDTLGVMVNEIQEGKSITTPIYLADKNYLLGFNAESNFIVRADGENIYKPGNEECGAETCLCFFTGTPTGIGKAKKCILLKEIKYVRYQGDGGLNSLDSFNNGNVIPNGLPNGGRFLILDGSTKASLILNGQYLVTGFSTRLIEISRDSDTISLSIIA